MDLFTFETISVAQPGNYIFSVVSYFFAQAGNVYINCTVEHIHFIMPYLGQYVFAGKHTSLVLQQKKQNFEFLFGKGYFFSTDGDLLFGNINHQIPVLQLFLFPCLHVGGTAEYSFYTHAHFTQ